MRTRGNRLTGWLALLVLLAALGVVAGCGGDEEAAAPPPPAEPAEPAPPAEEPAPAEPPPAEPPPADTGAATETETGGETGGIPSLDGKTIAYIQTTSVEYFEQSMAGSCAAVEEMGGECLVLNSNYEPETELKNVQDAIAQGVDGILLFSISQATFETSSRLAAEAGIPVVDFYGWYGAEEGDAAAFIGANAYRVGQLDGEGMVAALGDCPGCEVAQVQGQLGRGEVEDYARGFEEVIAAAGYAVVDKPTSHWSRQEAFARMQELLQKYPDLKGVYCHNDDTTVGCVQALKGAEKNPGDIKIVTLNASETGLQLIEEGWLQADVGWSPAEEGAMAARMLAQTINGEATDFPFPCYSPLTLVTADNIDEAESWVPTAELAQDWLANSQCEAAS